MHYADMHIHSLYSDGTSTVEEIFQEASKAGVSCISITDHDSLAAYEDQKLLKKLSREYAIELIQGIEFSANWGKGEVHLLGYFVNKPVEPFFYETLKKVQQVRHDRVLKIIQLLKDLGLDLDLDEFLDFIKLSSSPSRLHVATFLLEKGYVQNIPDAFRRYLGDGKPAYVNRFMHSCEEAIALLKKAGAKVLLAHPIHVKNMKDLDYFVEKGLDGLEVFYPIHSDNLIIKYDTFVQEHGLLATGGSDFHGAYKKNNDLGCIKLPYVYVEDLKNKR